MYRSALKRESSGVVLVALALLLAACAGGGVGEAGASGGEPGGIVVDVSMTEFEVEMDQTDFPVGVPVTFNITNDGAIEHELILEPLDVINEPLSEDVEARGVLPGDTVSFTYTFDQAGTLQLACHIAGHYEAGMFQEISASG
jgi:uncharacterized cupredoxin-like copper-binding protein